MFGGISILVIIDYRSRYLIARPVRSTNFECSRKILEEVFEKEGYPKSIKSDNGPPFNGTEYKEYCAERGIATIFSTPLFPQQNGMVESAMKVVNKAMIAASSNKTNYIDELCEAVHAYNAGAHSITKLPPEEIMLGRKIKRGLPLLDHRRAIIDDELLNNRDRKAKLDGKLREDSRRGARKCRVKPGDTVIIQRQVRSKGQSRFSSKRYEVTDENNGSLVLKDSDGQTIKRHVSQTRKILHGLEPDTPRAIEGEIPKIVEESCLNRRGERTRNAPEYLKQCVRSIDKNTTS
ncbi:uncharacterized protein K02A2.6-like [Topomyia yanbarensis]|uniref:uncharacterized protein K02A2.6-like n=1 Tax=Topomyia yanbarensis TaxID=2498891 RepID=UPI00273C2FAA|nr:uncharacterized protein K02A2.6-like [Topomyia yanbarensis]